MRVKAFWAPVLLMGAVGGLLGVAWGWQGALLVAPLSAAVGWAVGQQRRRR